MRSLSAAVRRVPTIYPLVLAALFVALLAPLDAQAQFAQQSELTASDEIGTGRLGHSVALSADGSTAIVGGYDDNSNVGAAWVYVRDNAGNWTQQQKLFAADTVGTNIFQGYSVSLSGDGNTALVGGENDNSGVGATWVYTRSSGTWTKKAKLIGTGATGNANQGVAVALSSDGLTAIVGGSTDNTQIGAAWIFTFDGSNWNQVGGKLTPNDATGSPVFGQSVAISSDGTTAIIGGAGDNNTIGAAWVFILSTGSWIQQGSKLTGQVTSAVPAFGHSVGLSGDGNTAIVGAPDDANGDGTVTIFVCNGGVWSQQGPVLSASDANTGADQGESVALSADGNTAIIGGDFDRSFAGSAWIFVRSGGAWVQQGNKMFGTGAVGSGEQGYSAAISADGNTAIIGGLNDNSSAGAAWVFAQTPTVTSVSPSTGSAAGGTAVTIKGTGFAGVINSGVDFNGFAVSSLTVVDPTTITTTTPGPATPASVDVHVANSIGIGTLSNGFTYVVPSITTVSPSSGPQGGGAQVTITGSDFTGATQVDFGLGFHATTFSVVDDSHITATTAAHGPGLVDVYVTTVDGLVAKSNAFTYVAAPTINNAGVQPSGGSTGGGTTVTITGTHFTGVTAVTFDGVPAQSFSFKSDTKITAVTPGHATGGVEVDVVTPGGSTAPNGGVFTFLPPPAITSISPTGAPLAGGGSVTIKGSGFSSVFSVKFGATDAAFNFISGSKITATIPAHPAGTVNLSVKTLAGTATTNFGYFAVPTITAINPNTGPANGGTLVSIVGTNLTGATGVKFGATAATSFSPSSATAATATAPAHAVGAVNVTVTTPGGTSAVAASDKFTYTPTPKLTYLAKFAGGTNDGGKPYGWLVANSKGVLYGTTSIGGSSNKGTVFSLTPGKTAAAAWKKKILHSFSGTDGATPYAGLTMDAGGNFYGTTTAGGAHGKGVVFKLTAPTLSYSVLYSFNGSATDGGIPFAGLAVNGNGVLFGATTTGGTEGFGTVFKMSAPSFAPVVLHSFPLLQNGADGKTPHGTPILDKNSNIYGTAFNGGITQGGAVFKLTPTGTATALNAGFGLNGNGAHPYAGLFLDSKGAFYGTTFQGGTADHGTVFKFSLPGAAANLLYKFTGISGSGPDAGVVGDAAGVLFGATFKGGAHADGTVFELLPPANGQSIWNESVLYSFKGGATDGANPYAHMLLGSGNKLYGTASGGGATACTGGCGMVFMIEY